MLIELNMQRCLWTDAALFKSSDFIFLREEKLFAFF